MYIMVMMFGDVSIKTVMSSELKHSLITVNQSKWSKYAPPISPRQSYAPKMVNGLYLYTAFIVFRVCFTVQFWQPPIHTHGGLLYYFQPYLKVPRDGAKQIKWKLIINAMATMRCIIWQKMCLSLCLIRV